MDLRRRILVRLCALSGMLLLPACGLSPVVSSDVLSYHETADLTANRIILLNVLRARDDAPLHFAELSLQHGQVSEQGGVMLAQPVGEIPHSTSLPRAILTPSATVGDQVAFDLGTLDTENFTRGVTAPIDPKMLKYFLDSGMDHRLVVMLLVSGVRLPGGEEAIANFPRSERWVCYPDGFPPPGELPTHYEMHALGENSPACKAHDREFVAFLRVLNALRRIYAVSYRPFIPIGAPFMPDVGKSLHDLLAMDPARQDIRPAPGGRLQLGLLAPEDKIVLCEEAPSGPGASPYPASPATTKLVGTATPEQICGATNASPMNADSGQGASQPNVPDFTLRSTLGIFAFLGQVLGSQENRSTPGNDVCIRLDPPQGPNERPSCDKGQVLFHLTHNSANARFGVEYDGQYWGVPNAAPCTNSAGYCDHTLETLSMLSLLLNLNKSARDIPSTPAVQLVP
jgi:hypothetical protein